MRFSKTKIALASVFIGAMTLGAASLAACQSRFNPNTDIPGINNNAVFLIENNHLSFALNMSGVDDADVIAKCGCTLTDDEGHEVAVTKEMLDDGRVKYDKFDLNSTGTNKQITVSYKEAVNYIFYDVSEYNVVLYSNGDNNTVWKNQAAEAQLTDDLSLAVWVDLADYNYSTDMTARQTDTRGAERFCGWFDNSGNAVTGRKMFRVTQEPKVTLELNAHYLSDSEFSQLKLSYDNLGRRVFSGYSGTDFEVTVPEGVTYVNFADIFRLTPEVTPIEFTEMNIPSTARLDVPLTGVVNTVGLQKINVDSGNANYASYNGGLYSKDYKTLHFLPASYDDNEFHPNLETIGTYACAYWQCRAFTIPDGVKMLQDYCFYSSALMRVEGFEDVIQGAGVFYGTGIPEMNISDGVGSYILMGTENGKNIYSLTRITDRTITDYTVMEGTVSIADSAFNDCTELKTVDLGNELKKMGNLAFSGCSSLESITLPKSLVMFGEGVFYGCSSLKTVDMSALVKMDYYFSGGMSPNTLPGAFFRECKSLASIELPSFIEAIGSGAFYNCTALEDINLKDIALKEIASSAFYGMGTAVADGVDLVLPKTVTSLGRLAFSHSGIKSVNLAELTSLVKLDERNFEYCRKLSSVEIPAGITEIPAYCFYYTPALKTVKFNDVNIIKERAFAYAGFTSLTDFGNVKELSERAFSSCTSLTTVTITDSVTTVGGYAFASCSKLTSITLGKNVQTFGVNMFESNGNAFETVAPALYSCSALKTVNVADGNEYFKSIDGVLYGRYVSGKDFGEGGVLYMLPASNGMTEYSAPSTLKVTLPYSINAHKTVTEIKANDGLENIGKATFYSSKKLASINIPASVNYIGANIFLGCSGLKSVSLDPNNKTYESVTGNLIYLRASKTVVLYTGIDPDTTILEGTLVIDDAVFMSNTKITSIVIPDSVISIGAKAFDGCTSLQTLTIGAGVMSIDPTAFASLKSLKTITVSPQNRYFKTSADNTILYSKDGKKLWLCAVASSTLTDAGSVLEGVEEIGNYAFAYHKALKTVILPDSVTTIGDYAFYNCRAIETVYGSPSLVSIGNYAFALANESGNPSTDMRYGNALKNVLLYGNLKSLGNYSFYGHYGIENAYFVMTYDEYVILSKTGTNSVYLTRGCPDPSGAGYVNNDGKGVNVYIYSQLKPLYSPENYSYFYLEDGEPVVWQI